MESSPAEMDEARLDAAISDILAENLPTQSDMLLAVAPLHPAQPSESDPKLSDVRTLFAGMSQKLAVVTAAVLLVVAVVNTLPTG